MFAEVLRRQRQSAGLTQAELAARAGLGERTVSNLERGINKSPYPNTVRLLSDALGLPEEARAELAAAARAKDDRDNPPAVTGGYLGATPEAQLIARLQERTALLTSVAAAATGAGRVVLLTGEPGIGKTRLAQDAATVATERGFVVATGRCYEPNSATPFGPFLEALPMLYRVAPAQVRTAVADRWAAMKPLLPDEFPASRSATSPAAADEVHRLYRAVSGFVRDLAARTPVAILLDDLHWADAASLALLAHLARQSHGQQRVLLLGAFRDVGVARHHPVRELAQSLRREGQAELISVGRLDEDAVRDLITDRLDDAPVSGEFVTLVHRHAQGNPFFTVEILLALIERGDLSRIDGRWVRREVSELEAPASVSDAIGERVARLSPTTQTVLNAVSVLGEMVEVEDLASLGIDDRSMETSLDEAVAAGLLTAADTRYAFDHVLTQQALYSAMSPIARRRLHRTAGVSLESRPPLVRRRRAAEIARHLEAGGAPRQAIPHVLVAGDTAAEIYAQTEALQHYRHALELAEEADDQARLAEAHERIGTTLISTGAHHDAVDHLVRAADTYQASGGADARLRVEGLIAHAYHRSGAGEVAAKRLDSVIAELDAPLDSAGQDVAIAVLSNGLARVRLALRDHPRALEAADRSARLAAERGLDRLRADADAVRGTILLFLDQPDDALRALERATTLSADLAAATAGGRDALLALQWTLTMRGELQRALTVGDRGLEVTRIAGDRDAEALHAANRGLTLFYLGDWSAAGEALEYSIGLARSAGPTLFSGIPPAYLGVLRRGQGDLDAAEACYREAATAPDLTTFAFDAYADARLAELDLLRGSPPAALRRLEPWLANGVRTRPHGVLVLCTAAEAYLDLGDVARGDHIADRALERAAATHNMADGIDAHRLKARSDAMQGRIAEAKARIGHALKLANAVPLPLAEARLYEQRARIVAAVDERHTAAADVARAHVIFKKLGADHDAARATDFADSIG